jgi:glucan biosynthesis protein C
MRTDERRHDLDNLRALAMLAGVGFHAALAYSPLAHPVFPTADSSKSALVDPVIWFLHLVRMPVFFVVAGFFTAMQIKTRGMAGMMRSRALRIGVPFLVGVPLAHLALASLTLQAAESVAHPSPFLAWLRGMQEAGPLPEIPPGTSHLWFLFYLLIFLVLVWVARAFELGRSEGRLGARIAGLHPLWIVGLLPVLLAPALASVPAPHPAPESLLPQFWALSYYGAFFTLGFLMHGHPQCMHRLRAQAAWLFAGSLVLFALYYALLVRRPPEAAFAPASWPLALLAGTIGVWATIACLAFAETLLARRNGVLSFLSDAAYWTYLVHLPILFAIQYRLLDVHLPWPVEFALAVGSTLAICLLSHRLLVRTTPVRRVVGGGSRSE